MRIRDTCRLLNRLLPGHAVRCRLGSVHAESDIGIDRVVEQDRFLTDDTHQGTQIVRRMAAYVRAVDGDGALRRVIETRYQIGHGRLTATRLPDERHCLALRNLQTDVRQHFAIRLVRKMDMMEGDALLEV